MSDTTDDTNQNNSNESAKDLRTQLEAALSENRTLKEWKTTRERNEAFTGAGLDLSTNAEGKPNNPLHALFAKGYDGKQEADAIKAAALEATVITPPQNTEAQQDAGLHAQMDRASYGADPVAASGTQGDLQEKLKTAKNQQEFYAVLNEFGMTKQG